jgi:hypothetical protein
MQLDARDVMADEPLRDMDLGISFLRTAVKRKFDTARQSKDLIFSDTEVVILKTQHGIPVGSSATSPCARD